MDFAIGGAAASFAVLFTNPPDMIKTRQQLQGELQRQQTNKKSSAKLPYHGILRSAKIIIESEGIRGLQRGLCSAAAFQMVMNSTRLGLFQTADHLKLTRNKAGDYSPVKCVFYGAIAGAGGATLGCPLFMIKTQIQSQATNSKYAVGYQHSHTGTVNAFVTTFRQQGVKGLWRGCSSFIPRTAVGSAIQLSSFSSCKDFFSKYDFFQNSTFATAFASSLISGFVTCVGMTPFDVIVTRIFNQGNSNILHIYDIHLIDNYSKGLDPKTGKGLLYRNFFDCFAKTFKVEGIRGLYKGFTPNYWRLAPHTMLNLTFWEQLKKLQRIYLTPNVG